MTKIVVCINSERGVELRRIEVEVLEDAPPGMAPVSASDFMEALEAIKTAAREVVA